MIYPKVGKKAPSFTLPDQDGKTHKLSDYLGQQVLVYFYPKDDTPGCTTEACTIRDSYADFEKMDVKVFGISRDSISKHKKFQGKYTLPFTLLSDENGAVCEKYGTWQLKKFMGKEYMGIARVSFLIDEKGMVKKVYESVKPNLHASQVLTDAK